MEIEQQSLGAFLQCYKNPYATFKCLESFRNHYPTSTIVLLSDNGYDYTEMAKHFNCIYIHEKIQYLLTYEFHYTHIDLSVNTWGWINRLQTALSFMKEDYMMWLEDDVSVNHKIDDLFRYDLNGYCPNIVPFRNIEEVRTKYPFIEENKNYHYSGHGGSVFHVSNMLKYIQNKPVIEDIMTQWKNYFLTSNIGQDLFFSIMIHFNQGTIGRYKGHKDCNHYNPNVTVQHQYKVWYYQPLPMEWNYLVTIHSEQNEYMNQYIIYYIL